ncbi:unnamed protein product [Camellia sinensis]
MEIGGYKESDGNKAETLEDLYEWKAALEEALALAPSATLVMGQNGIFRNDQADTFDGYVDQLKDRQPVKSLVIGRPILLALEDIDGTPSFLEKALRFVEEHGFKKRLQVRQASKYGTDRGRRVAAMREAICETFPEPNRRLLQR